MDLHKYEPEIEAAARKNYEYWARMAALSVCFIHLRVRHCAEYVISCVQSASQCVCLLTCCVTDPHLMQRLVHATHPEACCPHHIWGRGCLSQWFKILRTILSFQPSSPTLTPLNPNSTPALGHSSQACTCQGSLCSPLVGTEACALKLSPPSLAASTGGYLPHGSPSYFQFLYILHAFNSTSEIWKIPAKVCKLVTLLWLLMQPCCTRLAYPAICQELSCRVK